MAAIFRMLVIDRMNTVVSRDKYVKVTILYAYYHSLLLKKGLVEWAKPLAACQRNKNMAIPQVHLETFRRSTVFLVQ